MVEIKIFNLLSFGYMWKIQIELPNREMGIQIWISRDKSWKAKSCPEISVSEITVH